MCLIYDIYCTIYFIEVEIKHKIYPCAIYVKSVQYWGPVICFFELLSVIMFTLAFIYIRSLTWGRLLLFFFIIVVNNFLQPFGNNIGHRCFSLNSISISGRMKFDVEKYGYTGILVIMCYIGVLTSVTWW